MGSERGPGRIVRCTWREFRAGARAVAPMLVGVVPFGLVAGASPAEEGLGAGAAIGFSTIVFAGASQLAAIDVLGDGGSALVAAVAAWTINLRMLLYSASLAPHLAAESLRTRLGVAYLLTDQAYAVSITRWDGTDDPTAPCALLPGRRTHAVGELAAEHDPRRRRRARRCPRTSPSSSPCRSCSSCC